MRKLLLALVLAMGCAHSDAAKTETSTKSLYDRLGGKEAITAVVDDFVGRVAQDTRINQRFANTDIPNLKRLLVEQICQATGGPCQYTGRDMKTAHKGMNITEDEFNALVEDLKGALAKFNVGDKEQSELLGALGGMKGDIVGQ
jgi:hemoglobin